MSYILAVGNVTWDVIQQVEHYPQENEEMRASEQWQDSGGNAANTLRVLADHRHRCDFAGVIAHDVVGERIQQQLQRNGVNLNHASFIDGQSPLSHIIFNTTNGSRTIVHYRDLPEFSAQAFEEIPVSRYDWVHFEGRNPKQLPAMLAFARDNVIDQPISLELEKLHPGLEAFIPLTDIVFFSQTYAQATGFNDPAIFLTAQQALHGTVWMTCTWGEQGAWAIDQYGECLQVAAPLLDKVVDTRGAGDTFNAGMIHALVTGQPLDSALAYAVQLAGRKVQQRGFAGLG